jgi:spermidine synthase
MHQRDPERGVKVGIVGMGAGSLAAYARPGDRFRFYEIDPSVIEIAKNQDFFTYLKESRGVVDVVPGDGRLSLEAEFEGGSPQGFDILVIDAFSSDAIPFHLLTLEAVKLYQAHLAPGGFLAVHVSNRHFDLAPIIYRAGSEIGLTALSLDNMAFGIRVATDAHWIFLSRDFAKLETFARRAVQRIDDLGLDKSRFSVGHLAPAQYQTKPLWTDDFNSLMDVLRFAKKTPLIDPR